MVVMTQKKQFSKLNKHQKIRIGLIAIPPAATIFFYTIAYTVSLIGFEIPANDNFGDTDPLFYLTLMLATASAFSIIPLFISGVIVLIRGSMKHS